MQSGASDPAPGTKKVQPGVHHTLSLHLADLTTHQTPIPVTHRDSPHPHCDQKAAETNDGPSRRTVTDAGTKHAARNVETTTARRRASKSGVSIGQGSTGLNEGGADAKSTTRPPRPQSGGAECGLHFAPKNVAR
jgi:hypothetical protein